MRHGKRGRKLGRTASHRKAMLGNMATSLFAHGSIRTTVPKAKELRSMAERLITFAKRGDLHARRQVLRRIRNKVVVSKLFDEIAPTFVDRNGGYTRLLKVGPRRGDSTEICLIELVGDELRSEYAEGASSQVETETAVASEAVEEAQETSVEEVPEEETSAGEEDGVSAKEEASAEEGEEEASDRSEGGAEKDGRENKET